LLEYVSERLHGSWQNSCIQNTLKTYEPKVQSLENEGTPTPLYRNEEQADKGQLRHDGKKGECPEISLKGAKAKNGTKPHQTGRAPVSSRIACTQVIMTSTRSSSLLGMEKMKNAKFRERKVGPSPRTPQKIRGCSRTGKSRRIGHRNQYRG